MSQLATIAQRLAQEPNFREQVANGTATEAMVELSAEERNALSALRLPLTQTTNQLKDRLLRIRGPNMGW